MKASQPGNAIPWYKEALRRRPESLAAALGLGDAFEKSGDEANALEAFRQATRISPADAGAWRQLGEAQLKLGRTADAAAAVVALQKSLELDGEVPETHYALASFVCPVERDRARDHFDAAIRVHPEYGLGHYNFGLMLIAQNHLEEARRQMELAVQYGSSLDSKTREAARQRLSELRGRR